MTTYDFVHLVLYAAGGEINGRTKLQKTVYFIGAMTGRLDRLGYRAHYFGPYSSDVSAALDQLRSLKFLSQQVASVGVVDANGFERARYDYKLTDDGVMIAQEKATKNPTEWQLIQGAMAKLKRTNVDDYVKLSIAAKSLFLSHVSGKLESPEARSDQTSKYGWAVSPDQFREADRLLQAIELMPSNAAN